MMRLLILFAAVLMASCRTHKELPVVTVKNDTVTVVRERLEYIHDTARVEIPVQVAAAVVTDSSYLENDYATSSAFIDTCGLLHHNLKTKPGKMDVPYLKEKETRDSIVSADREVPVPYYIEKKLPWYDKLKLKTWWELLIVVFAESLWILYRRRKV